MAFLYVAELQQITQVTNIIGDEVSAARLPPIAEQRLVNTGGSVQSAPFNALTKFIRVHTDTVCSIVVGAPGSNPTAAVTNLRLAGNQTEYFGVYPGGILAVIANT
jgi:hypothetical protein